MSVTYLPPLSLLCFLSLLSLARSDQLQTLLNLSGALQSPSPDVFSSWKPATPICNFTGVTCDGGDSVGVTNNTLFSFSAKQGRDWRGKVGRLMANNNPADHGGRRRGAELVDQIVAIMPHLDSLEEHLIEALQYMDVPANTNHAKIMRIYTMLKFVKMSGQNMDPTFRLMFTVIAVALKCVKCGLLMYVLFGNMPRLIFVLCILMAFAFITN